MLEGSGEGNGETDTIFLIKYDSIKFETLYYRDTGFTIDTVFLERIDTIYQVDTLIQTIHDTLIQMDTIIQVIHDTLIQMDTTVIHDTTVIIDTLIQVDTLIVPEYIYDTTYITDTLWQVDTLHDTTVIIDTIYVGDKSIDSTFFALSIQPIFNKRCVVCHEKGGKGWEATGADSANGLDLSEGKSYLSLVNQPTFQKPKIAPIWRVLPKSPSSSYLVEKVSKDSPKEGLREPLGLSLPKNSIQKIVDWVRAGSPIQSSDTIP